MADFESLLSAPTCELYAKIFEPLFLPGDSVNLGVRDFVLREPITNFEIETLALDSSPG